MLPFADLQLDAEHELKGGGVPSPEGLQYSVIYPSAFVRICRDQPGENQRHDGEGRAVVLC